MGQEHSSERNKSKLANVKPVGEIVVVKSGKNTNKNELINNDVDIVKLNNINTFSPLMNNSLANEFEITNKLDSRVARSLCLRYEDHLRACANAVAFDQEAILLRVKEIENHSGNILRNVIERHKRIQNEMHLISTVEDVKQSIDKVENSLQHIIPLMDKINLLLPEEERLEPFLKI